MASVAKFSHDIDRFYDVIEQRCNEVDDRARTTFAAARTIDRIFRGYITREWLKRLHGQALIIQTMWRAFMARCLYRKMLKDKYDSICWDHYHNSATYIQRVWRGYKDRKTIFSYIKLKTWLDFVNRQNKRLRDSMAAFQHEQNSIAIEQREEEAKEWIIYILFKLHHLVRSRQVSGVYSLPNTANLSQIEELLQCLKYKDFMIFYREYMNDVRLRKAHNPPPYILQHCHYLAHFEKEYYEHKRADREHPLYLISRGPWVPQKTFNIVYTPPPEKKCEDEPSDEILLSPINYEPCPCMSEPNQ